LGGASAGSSGGVGASANPPDTRAGEGGTDTGGAGHSGTGEDGAGQGGSDGGAGSGSEDIETACRRVCNNTPVDCFAGAERTDCYYHCEKEGAAHLSCAGEYIAYNDCLVDYLDAGAYCTYENGSCEGEGCTASAMRNCGRSAERYDSCVHGCAPAEFTGNSSSCSLVRRCKTTGQTDCVLGDNGQGQSYWSCVCYYDGQWVADAKWPADQVDPCYIPDCGYR
jgi:hypothetical protein